MYRHFERLASIRWKLYGTSRLPECGLRFRAHDVIFEIAGAVRLGPESDFARDWRTQHRIVRRKQIRIRRASSTRCRLAAERVIERQSAVDPGLQTRALHS